MYAIGFGLSVLGNLFQRDPRVFYDVPEVEGGLEDGPRHPRSLRSQHLWLPIARCP